MVNYIQQISFFSIELCKVNYHEIWVISLIGYPIVNCRLKRVYECGDLSYFATVTENKTNLFYHIPYFKPLLTRRHN